MTRSPAVLSPSGRKTSSSVVGTLSFAVPAVAVGIWLLVRYRPTPEYWATWSIGDHAVSLTVVLAAGAIAGWWYTRNLLRALLVALSSLFLVGGAVLWANAIFDRSTPSELSFLVRAKERTWVERSRNSYWEHTLVGETVEGRQFRFSTHVSNLTPAEWDRADTTRGDRVVVLEHSGFLGIPWWRIVGLRPAP